MPPRSSKTRGPAPYALAPARWDERRPGSPDESDVESAPRPPSSIPMRETVKQTPFRVIKEPELRPIPSPPWKSRPLKRPREVDEEERRNVRTIAPHHPTYDIQHSHNGEFCSSSKTLPPIRSLSPPHPAISRPLLAPSFAYSTPDYPPPPTEAYQFRNFSRTPDYSTKNSNGTISDDDMNDGGSSYAPPPPQQHDHRRPASPGQRHSRHQQFPSPPLLHSPLQRRQVPSSRPPSPPLSALHRRVPSYPPPPPPPAQHRRVLSHSHSEPVPPSPLPPPPSASSSRSSGSSHRRGPQPAPPGPNHGFHSLTRRDLPSALEVQDSHPGEWYEREKREREYQRRLRRDEYYEERHRQHEARAGHHPRSPPPPLRPRSPPPPPQQQQHLHEYARYLHGPTPPPAYAPQHSPQQRPMDYHLPPLRYQQHRPLSPHQRQPPYQYTSYPPPPSHVPSHPPTLGRPPKRNLPKRAPNLKPRPKRPSQPLPKHQRLLQTPTPSPPPGAPRALPLPAPHVWVSMGGHGYGPEGGYEVHLHGQGKKERVANGGGALMNGNGQRPRDGSMERGVANGDCREERDPSAAGYELREGSRGGQLPLPSSYPAAPPPPAQTAFSLSMGPQEHLMMIPMNHVGGAQFVLKPPKMPKARGKVRGRPRGDADIGEKTLETAAVEKVDTRDVRPDVSVKETAMTATTTTGVNGGEDVTRNDERDISDASASEDDDDESVDSSLHTHYALHPNTSAQNSEARARSSLLPSSSSLQPDPGGSETNTFAAPPRPSRKIKRYPCDVCGQIFTRSGDVRRHKESRHSEGSSGCRCRFCGRVLTRQDALQRHWDKYCRKRSKRHLERQTTALGSSGPSGMGALVGGVNGMVMSRVVGNGQGVMQEVGGVMGVMDGFSPGASFEENGVMTRRRRGASISSAEGDSVPGGSVRNGNLSRSRSGSGSWSRSGSPSRSRSRSRSPSVEIIENPYARPNPSNRSPPDAGANARNTTPDEVRQREARFVGTS